MKLAEGSMVVDGRVTMMGPTHLKGARRLSNASTHADITDTSAHCTTMCISVIAHPNAVTICSRGRYFNRIGNAQSSM